MTATPRVWQSSQTPGHYISQDLPGEVFSKSSNMIKLLCSSVNITNIENNHTFYQRSSVTHYIAIPVCDIPRVATCLLSSIVSCGYCHKYYHTPADMPSTIATGKVELDYMPSLPTRQAKSNSDLRLQCLLLQLQSLSASSWGPYNCRTETSENCKTLNIC